MTTEQTSPDQDTRRDGSAVQRGVRPRAWLLEGTQAVEFDEQRYHAGSEWTALYDRAALNAALAAERERWKRAAEEMAQEADHKFTMDGTVAHWLRALVAKRGA
jgi:hypothetical protein